MVFKGMTLEVQEAGSVAVPELAAEVNVATIFADLWAKLGHPPEAEGDQ